MPDRAAPVRSLSRQGAIPLVYPNQTLFNPNVSAWSSKAPRSPPLLPPTIRAGFTTPVFARLNGQLSRPSAPAKSETPAPEAKSRVHRSLSDLQRNRTSIAAFSCSTKTKREGCISSAHGAEGPIVQVQRADMPNRIILSHIERIVRTQQDSVWPEYVE